MTPQAMEAPTLTRKNILCPMFGSFQSFIQAEIDSHYLHPTPASVLLPESPAVKLNV